MKKIAGLMFMVLTIANITVAEEVEQVAKKPVRLAPIVITPSRYRESELDVAKSVTVITAEDIEHSKAKYVPELLKSVAGINVRNLTGNAKMAQVDMGGFGDTNVSNVLVLVDGRRTNQIDLSGVDWAQIDVDSVERIEIVRGPQTVMYGDNATGGVINIFTKTGAGKKPCLGFKYELASYNYQLYRGHLEGGSDFMDYYTSLSTSFLDGYRQNSDLETIDYNAHATLKPADYLKLDFSGNYHKDWYGMPGGIQYKDINRIGRRDTTDPYSRGKTEDYYFMFSPEVDLDTPFGNFVFSTDLLHRGRRVGSIFWFTGGGGWETTTHIKTFGVTPKLYFSTNFFGIDNRMLIGFDYYSHKDEILDGSTARNAAKAMIIIEKQSGGVYVTDTINLTADLLATGGFRTEWFYYKFDQQSAPSQVVTNEPQEYAYEIGLNYRYNDRSAVYANYSRSFRAPVVDEWYTAAWFVPGWGGGGGLNTDLEPQVGINYEVGVKENTFEPFRIEASAYWLDTKHEIFFDPGIGRFGANALYDLTRRWGVDAEANLHLFDSLDIFANYTYQKAWFVGSRYPGHEIPMVPHHMFSAGLDYTFMDCVNLYYTCNYVGRRRYINDVQMIAEQMRSYMTHNFKISYKKYGLEIFGGVYNIFDEDYAEYGAINWDARNIEVYPSPGRNFQVGASYKF